MSAKTQSEQPQYAPQPDPNAQYGPATQPEQTPYQQQPVNQQYFAQPQAAPVQYVVMAESLKGVKGWLMFFTICFGLSGVSYTFAFFGTLLQLNKADAIILAIFAPFIAALSITTVVLTSMQKRLARWTAIATYAVSFVLLSLLSLVLGIEDGSAESVVGTIAAIFFYAICSGLGILYYCVSKRVKETLVG